MPNAVDDVCDAQPCLVVVRICSDFFPWVRLEYTDGGTLGLTAVNAKTEDRKIKIMLMLQ